jgi:glutaredoxin
MSDDTIKVFVSSGCGPCAQVKKMIEEGRFNLSRVDMVDVSTDEGFPYIEKLGLTKVPSAFKGSKECKILSDEETVVIDCDGEFSEK